MINEPYIVIVGAGIVGLSTAMHIAQAKAGKVLVLETEKDVAEHQTGNNSGVIHSGLYYKPGSAKAKNCAEGREAMYDFCKEYGIAHDRCGKIVVATHPDELPRMAELEKRGLANLHNTAEALPTYILPKNIELLTCQGVYSKEEILQGSQISIYIRQSGLAKIRNYADTNIR